MPTNLKHDQEGKERKETDTTLTKRKEGRRKAGKKEKMEGGWREERRPKRLWRTV